MTGTEPAATNVRPFEPMLAATLTDPATQMDWDRDWLVSPKLDGFRCVVRDGVALTRSLKPVRNARVQALLGNVRLNGLDGELIVGEPTPQREGDSVIARTSSGVTAASGDPNFTFWVFDDFKHWAHPFRHRIGVVEDRVNAIDRPYIKYVPHCSVISPGMLYEFEGETLRQGFEGVMLRDADAMYKFGRSTPTEQGLWKLKRFVDGEARVVELIEGQTNTNAVEENELGRSKRSTTKAGMRPNGQVGTIVAVLPNGARIDIAPGNMTLEERKDYWAHPEKLVRKLVKWKAFDYGVKDRLRHVTFVAVRDPSDLDAV